MATPGPPQARNAIKKSLLGLLGTKLADEGRDAIWTFFESACAYCGRKLDRSRREGHMDHVVAPTAGGMDGAANFVLACGACNGDEKREMHWEAFLATRDADPAMRREREGRIRSWMGSQEVLRISADEVLRHQVEQEVRAVIDTYNAAVERIKALRGDV